MSEADKIGLLANLPRCQAQQAIHLGLYDPNNYQAVYDLYLTAYGREELAQRAKSRAAERYVEAKTNAARQAKK